MQASGRALLSAIVDYAGLFPPAQLELEPAVRNFARYVREPDSWMLGGFVCPTARLPALPGLADALFSAEMPLRIVALGRAGDTAEAHLEGIASDLRALATLREQSGERVRICGFETRLPIDVLQARDGRVIRNLLDETESRFAAAGFAGVPRFFEPQLGEDWRETTRAALAGIAAHNRRRLPTLTSEDTSERIPKRNMDGLKLRAGGVVAAAFPTTEQVAFVIEQSLAARVPLKFTAGLHHPLRRYDPGVRTMMHGFLNVFAACVFAHASAFEFHDILAVIEELDANAFQIDDEFLSWNDADASAAEIQLARQQFCTSFGSCSFDEPRADLRSLRILP